MRQKEYFGFNSISKLKEIIDIESPSKIFLVTGKSSYEKSGAKDKIENILKGNIDYQIFNDFSNNPKYTDLRKGISKFKSEEFDMIIAIGGGSVIDMAKSINILAKQDHPPEKYILKQKKLADKSIPLCAIPTTSGTGSEATHFSVIYYNETKYSLANQNIFPDYVVLDPELTFSLSEYITASTGMDALCQAVESYWSVNSTEKSKKFAEKAIKILLKNINETVNNPGKLNRKKMMLGANYAGKAINISKTTAPHAFSYIVTSKCNVPHGHAVSLFLGEILIHNSELDQNEIVDYRGKEYVRGVVNDINQFFYSLNSKEARDNIYELMINIGLETSLSKLCKDVKVKDLIEGVNQERLKNNPVYINNIREIFNRIIAF
ncbi:phosphonoacetaldehyde reductase [Halanaerobium hydrogeniformans]|uniref:Iron-containing alcohol dehydrogenase n=1 Tax=Halanaerobium hydrogeniformans TaxID=656519 RepID=E4RNK6_HALHG|nr:phosphonoacetaldehyde reductase [Halanaerobium hydrogeniformans]ADQ13541.1 iron-containing alcohol dehydrogenase [Halanaerobium hydrogeniformans]